MKLLFAFLSACHVTRRSHVLNIQRQMKQWEHWGVKFDWCIVFGDPDSQAKEDVWRPQGIGLEKNTLLFSGINDTRRWMTHKNQALFRYALDREYDFVFRACDDSVVYPHRLLDRKLISIFDHDYFGTMCGYGQIAGVKGAFVLRYLDYMHGGVGIGLSNRAMVRLVNDVYPGPDASPYGKSGELDILPNHAIRGGWGTYWDDLWMGEVLKGHIPYSSPERNNTYFNYKDKGIEVYDDPQKFASNYPFDPRNVIATHSLDQMGKTNLTPGPFSTVHSKAAHLTIPYEMIDPKFNIHTPEDDAK